MDDARSFVKSEARQVGDSCSCVDGVVHMYIDESTYTCKSMAAACCCTCVRIHIHDIHV